MKPAFTPRYGLVACLLLTCFCGYTQKDSSLVTLRQSTAVWSPKGYSQSSTIDLGHAKLVLLSGQIPFDSSGNLVGKGDLGKQTEQVFLNLKTILAEAGGSMDNLVKLGIFLTDASQLQPVREVRDRYINTQQPPTSTLVEVSRLFRPDVLIEVEAMAVIPKK